MGKIIAVASGKGGTGKTTFTANTALALAAMGQRVLCLDCDITLRNLDLALGLSDRALMDFSDVMEGRCTLDEAAVPHEKYPSLFLLARTHQSPSTLISATGAEDDSMSSFWRGSAGHRQREWTAVLSLIGWRLVAT